MRIALPEPSPRAMSLAVVVGTLLLGGCALIQPPPVPSVPRLWYGVNGDASCGASIGRAHAALAAAGAAAGDPGATAAAHAAHAAAMSEYHMCLARGPRP